MPYMKRQGNEDSAINFILEPEIFGGGRHKITCLECGNYKRKR